MAGLSGYPLRRMGNVKFCEPVIWLHMAPKVMVCKVGSEGGSG